MKIIHAASKLLGMLALAMGISAMFNLNLLAAQRVQAAEAGSIAVRLSACPAGMRPLDLDEAACSPDEDVADLQIFILGSGEDLRDLTRASRNGDLYVWDALPPGEYLLQATALAPGYDRYLVPGLDGLNISPDLGYSVGPNEGFILPLDDARSAYTLDVYVFPRFAGDGVARLNLRFWQCAPGVSAAPDMRGLGCVNLASPPSGFSLELSGAVAAHSFDLAEATPGNDGALGWNDVASGEYRLTSRLPTGIAGYAVRSYDPVLRVQLLSDRSGYALVLNEDDATPEAEATVELDVYLLR